MNAENAHNNNNSDGGEVDGGGNLEKSEVHHEEGSFSMGPSNVAKALRGHACDICRQRFTRKAILRSHNRRVHGGQLPFKCDKCTAQFACASDLVRHSKVHATDHGEKSAEPFRPGSRSDRVPHLAGVNDEEGQIEPFDFEAHGPNRNISSSQSDLSSSGWTETGADAESLRLITLTSKTVLTAYRKLAATSAAATDKAVVSTSQAKLRKARSAQTRGAQKRQTKQKRKGRQDDNSEDEEHPKRQRQGCADPMSKDSNLLLACPFNKYDHRVFGPDSSVEAHRSCATCACVHIGHLKQHLQRNHYRPKHYCSRCGELFKTHDLANAHIRQQSICETLDQPPYRDRIGPDMIEELSLDRRNPPNTDQIEYWHRIYDTLFPGAADQSSVSPYYEGPAVQHLNQFLRFARPAVRVLLPIAQARLGLDNMTLSVDTARLIEEVLQDATQRYLEDPPNANVHIGQRVGPRLHDVAATTNSSLAPRGVSGYSAAKATGTFADSRDSTANPIDEPVSSSTSNASLSNNGPVASSNITSAYACADGDSRFKSTSSGPDALHSTAPAEISQYSHVLPHSTAQTCYQFLPASPPLVDYPSDYDWEAELNAMPELSGFMPDPLVDAAFITMSSDDSEALHEIGNWMNLGADGDGDGNDDRLPFTQYSGFRK